MCVVYHYIERLDSVSMRKLTQLSGGQRSTGPPTVTSVSACLLSLTPINGYLYIEIPLETHFYFLIVTEPYFGK